MNNSNIMYVGKVVYIDYSNQYGFIRSKSFSENIYFKNYASQNNLLKNMEVCFSISKNEKGIIATSVRKIFTNNFGIKFYSRANISHNHIDINIFLPLIFNNIVDYEIDYIQKEFCLGYEIGTSECIETNDSDNILYAIRKGRLGHTKFVLEKSPVKTSSIYLILKKTEYGYLIISIYFGSNGYREPYDERATNEDLNFWKNHALIFNENSIITESIVYENPWILNEPSLCHLKSNS